MSFGEHKGRWVTISLDEYESLRRTVEVLSDGDLLRQLDGSGRDKAAGRVRSFEEVARKLGV